jgi:small subunit ribosomal protein S20
VSTQDIHEFSNLHNGRSAVANSPSAIKRARQSERRRQHNVGLRSRMRTAVKKVVKSVAGQDAAKAAEAFKVAVPELDSMVRKGIIHPNKAARHKSRLNKAIKALAPAG